eukprot:UN02829
MPSINSLYKRAGVSPKPSFKAPPLVAFYLSIALKKATCIGGFSGDCLPLELRWTEKNDTFQAFNNDNPVPCRRGELSWTTENNICLSKYFTWKQSLIHRIEHNTQNAIFVAEILDD